MTFFEAGPRKYSQRTPTRAFQISPFFPTLFLRTPIRHSVWTAQTVILGFPKTAIEKARLQKSAREVGGGGERTFEVGPFQFPFWELPEIAVWSSRPIMIWGSAKIVSGKMKSSCSTGMRTFRGAPFRRLRVPYRGQSRTPAGGLLKSALFNSLFGNCPKSQFGRPDP